MGRGLGPRFRGIHRLALSGDDVGVETILDVGRSVGPPPETLGVVLVFSEEQLLGTIAMKPILAQLMVCGLNGAGPRFTQQRLCDGPLPRTRCCETIVSATDASGPLPARDCVR